MVLDSGVSPDLPADAADRFARDGYLVVPGVVPPDVLAQANAGMDAVLAGKYATGQAPKYRNAEPGTTTETLVKIDQVHRADERILELVGHPAIGAVVAAATGARRVQVWATQLLHKFGGSAGTGNVGWHQDFQYWREHWDGGVMTAWIAMVDVPVESGPVRFVTGSHRWGFVEGGDFFGTDMYALRERYAVPPGAEWNEQAAVLPAGGVSLHHCMTVHGSMPNVAATPRRAIAVHVVLDDAPSKSDAGEVFGFDLTDRASSPILFGS
ncbi:MAG TPA: phytanoyl-CoA dioxygenase family protein [Ilumatobacter sp.]|nr:phytanoyl-CoA dioxygenase family protein [Ilumatobacter sp.]